MLGNNINRHNGKRKRKRKVHSTSVDKTRQIKCLQMHDPNALHWQLAKNKTTTSLFLPCPFPKKNPTQIDIKSPLTYPLPIKSFHLTKHSMFPSHNSPKYTHSPITPSQLENCKRTTKLQPHSIQILQSPHESITVNVDLLH